jgi:anti-sigma regulatory factor (Ser/Thr protein kinase)
MQSNRKILNMVTEVNDINVLALIENPLSLALPCDIKIIRHLRGLLAKVTEQFSFSDEEKLNLDIVLNEAASNAIGHGSSNKRDMHFYLDIYVEDKKLVVVIKDFGGVPFNPEYFEKIAATKNWGKGGRGIFLIKKIMDEVAYTFNPGHSTSLYLSKRLPS